MTDKDKEEIKKDIDNSGYFKLVVDNTIKDMRVTKHTFLIVDTQNVDAPYYTIESVTEAVEFLAELSDVLTKDEIEKQLRTQRFDETKQLYLAHFS